MLKRSRWLVIALAVSAGALIAVPALSGAFGNSSVTSTKIQPISYTPLTRQALQARTPESALTQAVGNVGTTKIASARIGRPPPGSTAGGRPWLYATVRVPKMSDGLDIEPMWEADLLEGAVVEESGTSQNVTGDFGGATFDAILPDGTKVTDASGGLGDVVRGQQFSNASDATTRAAIDAALKSAGLTPIRIDVFHPLDTAVAVIASTSNGQKSATSYTQIATSLFGNPPKYEGYYFEIRNDAGAAFVRASASFRTGAGRLWVAPGFAGALGVQTLGRNEAPTQTLGRNAGGTPPPVVQSSK